MSTRSMLCIKQSDGSLKAMFKHWDGYPSFMMPFLDEFNSDELANELVRFGGCESFQTPEEKERKQTTYPDDYPEDKYFKCSNGNYIFYGYDSPIEYKNLKALWNDPDNFAIEYVYIWNGYKWVIIDPDADEIK